VLDEQGSERRGLFEVDVVTAIGDEVETTLLSDDDACSGRRCRGEVFCSVDDDERSTPLRHPVG
jgi:hypothetical protein